MGHIVFKHVTKRFDNGYEALSDVSTEFSDGSMTFLTGHSGAGKSTFLKLLICADVATRGQILVNNVDIAKLSGRRLPAYRRHLGVVFQDHHLLAQRNVYDNIAMPLRLQGMGEKEVGRRVRAVLTRVELLGKEGLYPRHLSTGEQQRVGIGRAVVTRPKVLLADEPTGNLDPELSKSIMDLFARFNQVGTTVVVASHDVDLIEQMGCRILHLEQGQVVSDQVGKAGFANTPVVEPSAETSESAVEQ